jgi:hypothetical protein
MHHQAARKKQAIKRTRKENKIQMGERKRGQKYVTKTEKR